MTTPTHQEDAATQPRPRLEIVYAPRMRPGDWYAGRVDPAAPARPVHLCASPFRVTRIKRFADAGERRMIRITAAGQLQPDPLPAVAQVLVIRERDR
jgi:hypothetical protein